tara:strand:+ start:49 stop:462 length:414 start_codon:yes stop_codon:yes gene_type:complete
MSIFRALAKAAAGDKEAQTAMANYALRLVDDPDTDNVMALTEGSIFARLALANGSDDERSLLITVLSSLGSALRDKGEGDLAIAVFGEVMAHVDALAEAGHPEADMSLPGLTERASPEIMGAAKEFKNFWRDEYVES